MSSTEAPPANPLLPALGALTDYDDSYSSCLDTYATLRVSSTESEPDEISRRLQLSPSSSYRKGDPISPRVPRARSHHDWLLSTEGQVASQDVRRHLDWLLDRALPAHSALSELMQKGAEADVFIYWHSRAGQGGPTLSVPQLSKLAFLGLEATFDLYFEGEQDDAG